MPYIGHGRNFVIYETPKSATNSVYIFQDRTMLIDFSFGIFLKYNFLFNYRIIQNTENTKYNDLS